MNDFFAVIYEFFSYFGQFSDDLYNEGLYTVLGLSLLIISLFMVVLYYLIINSPRFNKRTHWLMVLGVNFVINFAMVSIPRNVFTNLNYDYGSEYFGFGLINAFMSIIFFIAFSFAIKRKSYNCFNSPI